MRINIVVPGVAKIPDYQLVLPFRRLKTFLGMWRLGFDTAYVTTPQGELFGWRFVIFTPWLGFSAQDFYQEVWLQESSSSIVIAYRNTSLKEFELGYTCYKVLWQIRFNVMPVIPQSSGR